MSEVMNAVFRGAGPKWLTLLILWTGSQLMMHRAFGAEVTLAWDPSPDADVIGYSVYYGPASGTYTNTLSVGMATNATVSGLLEGGRYFFAATARNAFELESDPSNEVSYSVPTNAPNQS